MDPGKREGSIDKRGEQRSNETCPIPAVTYRNKLLRIVLAGAVVATRERGGWRWWWVDRSAGRGGGFCPVNSSRSVYLLISSGLEERRKKSPLARCFSRVFLLRGRRGCVSTTLENN